jgi:hypothetical protein
MSGNPCQGLRKKNKRAAQKTRFRSKPQPIPSSGCYSRQIETSTAQSWNEIYFGCFWIDAPNAQSKRVGVECVELYPCAVPMPVSGLITTEHKNPAIWVLSVLQRRTTGLANAPAFLIRQRSEVTSCNFTAPIATFGALSNPREVLLPPNCTQIFSTEVPLSIDWTSSRSTTCKTKPCPKDQAAAGNQNL